ncbi:MAG: cobalt-precorrin-6A reductase [Alphaproteobacteria bacterium]
MILILGGTGEAYTLAEALVGRDFSVTTSLAGRTASPRLPLGAHRIGGFGGAEGLKCWLDENKVRALIDATHPFSTRISEHARGASSVLGIPCLRLQRPPWRATSEDRWQMFADEAELAVSLPSAARVFLSLGRQRLDAFAGCAECYFVVRLAEAIEDALPFAGVSIIDKGPFDVESECRLFREYGITHLVARNSGGSAWQKLSAARTLNLPVFMIERPTGGTGGTGEAGVEQCNSVESAINWLLKQQA